jgi:intracellular septation protein
MTETKDLPRQAADEDGLIEGPELKKLNPVLKLVLELGPLVVFFFANQRMGIVAATGVFMVAALVALAVSYALTRRLPLMPVVSAVMLVVFGGLTLWFNDPVFIKLKPTVVNALFGTALLVSLWLGRPLLPIVLDAMLPLDAEGWRKLTLRWGLFFFVLAAINEVVWRTQSESFWIAFKAWGIMPLTLLFALSQTPLILRHEVKEPGAKE